MTSPQPLDSERRSLRVFIVSVTLTVAVCISGGFLGMALQQRGLIRDELLGRLRTDFRNIVQMRRWNAAYGGVFVEKKPGVESNPYLEHPDIEAADGRIYTKKNPALMTRELSEMLKLSEGYAFHITSLRPLNPGNQADARETEALRGFEQGRTEAWWYETRQDRTFLRYMAPLKVEPSCLACHAKQGYQAGEVRGGISVFVDIQDIRAKLQRNLAVVLTLAVFTASLLLGLVIYFFRQLVRRLAETRAQLHTLASTDPLTGLANRRAVLERLEAELERSRRQGTPLSCLVVDVDHFKQVNDLFGHLQGDSVLKGVAEEARRSLRSYDLLGRFGGEEFLAVLPGADLETAASAAERLRAAISEGVQFRDAEETEHGVTVSVGVAHLRADETLQSLLHRADEAMYLAKALGRNRVQLSK